MSRPFNTPNVYRAIAHPARRKMLDLLRKEPRTPGDLFGFFSLSRPAISQHLRTLRLAGLIESRPLGKGIQYALTTAPLREVKRWIQQYADSLH